MDDNEWGDLYLGWEEDNAETLNDDYEEEN